MKGLSQLMRQAQEMQANMQKAQDELASIEVEGAAAAAWSRSSSPASTKCAEYDRARIARDDKDMLEGPDCGRVQRCEPQDRAHGSREARGDDRRYVVAGRG